MWSNQKKIDDMCFLCVAFLFCYETLLGSIEHFYNRSRILKLFFLSCLYFSAKRCGSVYSGVCAHHVWQLYCVGIVWVLCDENVFLCRQPFMNALVCGTPANVRSFNLLKFVLLFACYMFRSCVKGALIFGF